MMSRSILFGVLLVVQAVAPPDATPAGPAPNSYEHISIPLRWCAVRGTPVVESSPGETGLTTDTILRGRHGRATAYVWMPEARISFRSAITTDLPEEVGFPLIDDPRPPLADGSGGAGQEGDILDPRYDYEKIGELNAVVASCKQAWDGMEDKYETNVEGIIAVNIGRFVRPDGAPSHLLGVGTSMHTIPYGGDRCRLPSNLQEYRPLETNDGWVVVVDNAFTVSSDPNDSVLAHELGHVLFLGHGNGHDDPLGNPPRTNDRFDEFCDRQEDVAAAPQTLMRTKRPMPNELTELQKANARAAARVTLGGMILHDGDPERGYVLTDDQVDHVGEVRDPSVDLRSLRIIYDTEEATTTLHYRLVGRLPKRDATHRFLVFSDDDVDPRTGGEPATLGFPTRFQGAEYVARVQVESRKGQIYPTITPTVWKHSPEGFVELPPDERVTASVDTVVMGDEGARKHDVISVQFPNDLDNAPPPKKVRFQAVVERIGGDVDRLPDEEHKGRLIRLSRPVYRACRTIPYTVEPGSEITIEVTGFHPNDEVTILVEEELIAKGTIDSGGNLSVPVPVPEDVEERLYLLVVAEKGTASTAHCVLKVERERTKRKVASPSLATPKNTTQHP